jgi:tetratricopeptide (TPR) repeat protein
VNVPGEANTREAAQQRPTPPATAGRPEFELVPAWLVAIVLVLLLAIVGVGGYAIRGLILLQKPHTVEELALERAQAEVASRSDDVQALLDLAYAYQQLGRYREAIDGYDQVLKHDPRNTPALYNKGMVYFQLRDPKRAEQMLGAVLDVSPTHVLASEALGNYYASKQEYRSLLGAVQSAAQAHPEMADLQYLVGLADEHLGKNKEAVVAYRTALKYVPDMKRALEGLMRLGEKP